MFTGAVTMLETPVEIGEQEEGNRGWSFKIYSGKKKGSEYM